MKLEVTNLVHDKDIENDLFMENLESRLDININNNEIIENNDWVEQILFTIPYIEKALRKPNKNIITEAEVVKIEKIKKVTVDSIKHLSKNTNLISQFDEKKGEVIPSKILNAFKEESYITYENRFIYTLIKLIDDFMFIRTSKAKDSEHKSKNYQKAIYEAKTKIKRQRIKLNLDYTVEDVEGKKQEDDLEVKIRNLQEKVRILKSIDLYQMLDGKKITLVTSPLKMTNVLLKNVNFQYAVKLWNYLNDNLDIKNKTVSLKRDYEEHGEAKKLANETFLLNYLIFNQINDKNKNKKNKKLKIVDLDSIEQKLLTDSLIDKIIEINPELAESELKKMIIDRYIVFKKKKTI